MSVAVLMSIYKNETVSNFHRVMSSVWDNQTYKPKEIILVQDGPLYEALDEAIGQWKCKLGNILILVRNDVNIGLTKSLNKGIAYVTSTYIARMDIDEVAKPNRFELQVAYLKNNPSIDILGGASEHYNENGEYVYTKHHPITPSEARKQIAKLCPLSHSCVMMKTSLFHSGLLKYDERYRNSQDIALWFDAMAAGCNIANLPNVIMETYDDDGLFQRRGYVRAKNEFVIFMRGIYKLYGCFTLKYIYPIMRLVLRLLPKCIVEKVYNSKFHHNLYAKNK